MNTYLFSYGTLQIEKVQLQLFGRILQGRRDVLKGYRAVPIEITESAFLAKGEQNYQLMAVLSNDKTIILVEPSLKFQKMNYCLQINMNPPIIKEIW